jgi:hypothetical protein
MLNLERNVNNVKVPPGHHLPARALRIAEVLDLDPVAGGVGSVGRSQWFRYDASSGPQTTASPPSANDLARSLAAAAAMAG